MFVPVLNADRDRSVLIKIRSRVERQRRQSSVDIVNQPAERHRRIAAATARAEAQASCAGQRERSRRGIRQAQVDGIDITGVGIIEDDRRRCRGARIIFGVVHGLIQTGGTDLIIPPRHRHKDGRRSSNRQISIVQHVVGHGLNGLLSGVQTLQRT